MARYPCSPEEVFAQVRRAGEPCGRRTSFGNGLGQLAVALGSLALFGALATFAYGLAAGIGYAAVGYDPWFDRSLGFLAFTSGWLALTVAASCAWKWQRQGGRAGVSSLFRGAAACLSAVLALAGSCVFLTLQADRDFLELCTEASYFVTLAYPLVNLAMAAHALRTR